MDEDVRNSFDILGLSYNSDLSEVKRVYREKVKQWNPDKFQELSEINVANEKIKDINIAYGLILLHIKQAESASGIFHKVASDQANVGHGFDKDDFIHEILKVATVKSDFQEIFDAFRLESGIFRKKINASHFAYNVATILIGSIHKEYNLPKGVEGDKFRKVLVTQLYYWWELYLQIYYENIHIDLCNNILFLLRIANCNVNVRQYKEYLEVHNQWFEMMKEYEKSKSLKDKMIDHLTPFHYWCNDEAKTSYLKNALGNVSTYIYMELPENFSEFKDAEEKKKFEEATEVLGGINQEYTYWLRKYLDWSKDKIKIIDY